MQGQLRVQYLGQVIVDDWGPEHFRESSVYIHHTSSRTGVLSSSGTEGKELM